jgi:hypothetical protein
VKTVMLQRCPSGLSCMSVNYVHFNGYDTVLNEFVQANYQWLKYYGILIEPALVSLFLQYTVTSYAWWGSSCEDPCWRRFDRSSRLLVTTKRHLLHICGHDTTKALGH